MYGFVGCYKPDVLTKLYSIPYKADPKNMLYDEYKAPICHIERRTLRKFIDDKVFFEDEKYVIVIEGVLNNSTELKRKSGMPLGETLSGMFHEYKGNIGVFINGNYCMCVVDKLNRDVFLITNNTSYKTLYYSVQNESVFFSTDYQWLIESMRANGYSIDLSEDGAIFLLSHGYMLGDTTIVKGVYKVLPCQYARITDAGMEIKEYFDYSKIEEDTGSYDSLLEKANDKFMKAVSLIYDKDNEYGYKHLCTLSGGLDSRSVAFVGRHLGYEQTFITMSQYNCLDEVVASRIASLFKEEHIVYHLDDSDFLLNVKDCIIANGGNITYPGFSHMYSFFQKLNLEPYGAVNTGEIGGLIFGGTRAMLKGIPTTIDIGQLSSVCKCSDYLDKDKQDAITSRYSDSHIFFLMNRGLNSDQNGWYASYYFTESAAPFTDFDFMRYMLSVPEKYKRNTQFYVDWMKRFYPEMCKFKWTTTLTRPDASNITKYLSKQAMRVNRRIFHKNYSMNPFDIWIKESEKLRTMLSDSFDSQLRMFPSDGKIHAMISRIHECGNSTDWFMVVTLNSAIKELNINVNM